jgi:hypothetical protein
MRENVEPITEEQHKNIFSALDGDYSGLARMYYHTGLKQGKSKEALDKEWNDTLSKIKGGHIFQDVNKPFLDGVRNGYTGDTDNRKNHLIRCIPDDYKYTTIDSWICETNEHTAKKGAALEILDNDRLQVWFGNTGRGKTMLATGVMKSAVKSGLWVQYDSSELRLNALFSRDYTQDSNGDWKSIDGYIRASDRFDLYVIDDFNSERLNDSQRGAWFQFLKHRIDKSYKTIVITNHSRKSFGALIGGNFDRIDRRISEYGKMIDFDKLPEWKSHRQPPLHTEKVGSPATKDQAVNQAMSMLSK